MHGHSNLSTFSHYNYVFINSARVVHFPGIIAHSRNVLFSQELECQSERIQCYGLLSHVCFSGSTAAYEKACLTCVLGQVSSSVPTCYLTVILYGARHTHFMQHRILWHKMPLTFPSCLRQLRHPQTALLENGNPLRIHCLPV